MVRQRAGVAGQVAQDLTEETGGSGELTGQRGPPARVADGQAERGGSTGLEGRLARPGCRGRGDDGLGGGDPGAVAVPGEDLGQDGECAPQRAELLLPPLLPVLARQGAAGKEPGQGGGRTVQAARERRGELVVPGGFEGLQQVGPGPGGQVALDEPSGERWQAG